MNPRALSASRITGTKVENLTDYTVGEIYDLMIDLETREVLSSAHPRLPTPRM